MRVYNWKKYNKVREKELEIMKKRLKSVSERDMIAGTCLG